MPRTIGLTTLPKNKPSWYQALFKELRSAGLNRVTAASIIETAKNTLLSIGGQTTQKPYKPRTAKTPVKKSPKIRFEGKFDGVTVII